MSLDVDRNRTEKGMTERPMSESFIRRIQQQETNDVRQIDVGWWRIGEPRMTFTVNDSKRCEVTIVIDKLASLSSNIQVHWPSSSCSGYGKVIAMYVHVQLYY